MRCLVSVAIAAVLLVVLACGESVLAHKSVRHRKPHTEEARWEHHRDKLTQPPEHHFQTDQHFMADPHRDDEFSPLKNQGHKSQHKRWGPKHPDWTKLHNYHYRRPALYQGHPIDHSIDPDDYHLFGLKHQDGM